MCATAQTAAGNCGRLENLLRTQCLIVSSADPKYFVRRPDKRCSP